MKKYFAEALGAGALTLVVSLMLSGSFPIATPVMAALTLGLFVYTLGFISGTHINPAITAGIWAIGKIPTIDAIFYIVAQFLGALAALIVARLFITMPDPTVVNSLMVGIAEMVGAFFFAFGVAAVVYRKVSETISGLVVGGSLLLGIGVAVTIGSNGVLNPAVALGAGSVGIAYVLGPIIGAVLGMYVYRYFQNQT